MFWCVVAHVIVVVPYFWWVVPRVVVSGALCFGERYLMLCGYFVI